MRQLIDFLISLPKKHPEQKHVYLSGNHDLAFSAFMGVLPKPSDGSEFKKGWKEYEHNEEREGWFNGDGYESMYLQRRRWAGDIKDRFNFAKVLVKAVPDDHKKFLADMVWIHEEDDVSIETEDGIKHCKLIIVHAGLEKGKNVVNFLVCQSSMNNLYLHIVDEICILSEIEIPRKWFIRQILFVLSYSRRQMYEAMIVASRVFIVITGDIHGYIPKLQKLWTNLETLIDPSHFNTALVIFLGDYCDSGPDTRQVIDFLISLPKKYPEQKHVYLSGNHDLAFSAFVGVLPKPSDGSEFKEGWKEYEHNEEREGWFNGDGYESMHFQGRRWAGNIKDRFNVAKGCEFKGSVYNAAPKTTLWCSL
ncbi:hypothetical protein Q3G72_003160 [Acer saccharum]|nr:hypothetical protein Q3G72_003160 [Acer saccharum]